MDADACATRGMPPYQIESLAASPLSIAMCDRSAWPACASQSLASPAHTWTGLALSHHITGVGPKVALNDLDAQLAALERELADDDASRGSDSEEGSSEDGREAPPELGADEHLIVEGGVIKSRLAGAWGCPRAD